MSYSSIQIPDPSSPPFSSKASPSAAFLQTGVPTIKRPNFHDTDLSYALPSISSPVGQDIEFNWPLPKDFEFEADSLLSGAQLQARLVGPVDASVVLVLGGISANRHVCPVMPSCHTNPSTYSAGWWADIVGGDLAIDTCRFRVLSFDFLPGDNAALEGQGEPGRASQSRNLLAPFIITTRDQARIAHFICRQLGIDRLHAFVGASYGGMIALSFAQQFPEAVERLAVLCAAHRPHPMGLAWRSIQRKLVRFGLETGEPDRALSLARELGMTTYRTAQEFGERFAIGPTHRLSETPSALESYLETRGQAFIGTMSSHRYLSLSQSIDSHYVDPQSLNVPLTLLGCRQDQLVPIEELRLLAASTPTPMKGQTQLIEFDSHYGHDAFLKEPTIVAQTLRTVLNTPIEKNP
jgi:homoserine O-acetyltransferase